MRVKGQSFKSIVAARGVLEGPRAVETMLARAPDDLAAALRSGAVVSGGWYPVEWYVALHRAAADATGRGTDLAEALSAEAVRQNFRGIYRFFALVITPEGIMARAPRAFRLFFSAGTPIVHAARPGFVDNEFVNCDGFDEHVWADAIGASKAMITFAGGHDVASRVLTGGHRSRSMRVELSWSDQPARVTERQRSEPASARG